MSNTNEQAMEAARVKVFQREYHDVGLEPPRHESVMWNYGFEAGWNAANQHAQKQEPIDVVLFCPRCKTQHIDKAEPDVCMLCGEDFQMHDHDRAGALSTCRREVIEGSDFREIFKPWVNPPHKSHRCSNCNIVWRPADVPTNGVEKAKTVGDNDTKDWGINPHETQPNHFPDITEMVQQRRKGYQESDYWRENCLTCGHLRRDHDDGEGQYCNLLDCDCPKFVEGEISGKHTPSDEAEG
jgi:hypothetical protein